MPAKVTPAVAYIRTDSAANFNLDKEGDKRQFDAISAYAAGRYDIAGTFYDPIVIGLDPIDVRRGFIRLLYYCREHGIGVVLVENAERFARDLYVQLTGHELLRRRGIELVPVDVPSLFTALAPTLTLIRQILDVAAQFERAVLTIDVHHTRERKPTVVAVARGLARTSIHTGKPPSLREIAEELARLGYTGPTGLPYHAGSIAHMLKKPSAPPRRRRNIQTE
jgi:DNA invertase Pin-like site-specific DNA recombinase